MCKDYDCSSSGTENQGHIGQGLGLSMTITWPVLLDTQSVAVFLVLAATGSTIGGALTAKPVSRVTPVGYTLGLQVSVERCLVIDWQEFARIFR